MLIGGLASAALLAPAVIVELTQPGLFSIPFILGRIALLGAVASMPAIAIGIVLLFPRRTRHMAASGIAGCAAYLLVLPIMFWSEGYARTNSFERLAVRSAPLVAAIRQYGTEIGQPPPDLAALAPDYLPAVPGTGFIAYPEYQYSASPGERMGKQLAWELLVPAGIGSLSWDVFLYWPERDYPRSIDGGYVERIGDWAYLHK